MTRRDRDGHRSRHWRRVATGARRWSHRVPGPSDAALGTPWRSGLLTGDGRRGPSPRWQAAPCATIGDVGDEPGPDARRATREVLVSVDVETSGPSPGTGSLLAIGACLVDDPAQSFYRELQPDPRPPWDPDAARVHGLDRDRAGAAGLAPSDGHEPSSPRGSTSVRGDGTTGLRGLQRPLRLDVRGGLPVAIPGPQSLRACGAGPEGAVHGARWRRAAGQPPASGDVTRALPGRPSPTPTMRSTTPGCRRRWLDGCWTTPAERRHRTVPDGWGTGGRGTTGSCAGCTTTNIVRSATRPNGRSRERHHGLPWNGRDLLTVPGETPRDPRPCSLAGGQGRILLPDPGRRSFCVRRGRTGSWAGRLRAAVSAGLRPTNRPACCRLAGWRCQASRLGTPMTL